MKTNEDYFERVWEIVARIPHGRVTTYGAISAYLGLKSGARMVGWALNKTIDLDYRNIPAHRVVNRLGELSGAIHFGPNVMRERLLQEGVIFIDEYCVDLEHHFWDPSST